MEATPITDDQFHSWALAHKLQRATEKPAIRQTIGDQAAQRQLKAGAPAAAALTDTQIQLPLLNPATPLEEVLQYRRHNPEALAKVRGTLGLIARRIQASHARSRRRPCPTLLSSLNRPPSLATPGSAVIVLAAAGLTLASGTGIPGAEWLFDWRDGKTTVQENGLHYVLRAP